MVKKVIKDLKGRKVDLDKLLIKTQLKKPIDEYKSISPHVAIAKKMREMGLLVNIGMVIPYYIAESGNARKS